MSILPQPLSYPFFIGALVLCAHNTLEEAGLDQPKVGKKKMLLWKGTTRDYRKPEGGALPDPGNGGRLPGRGVSKLRL